MFQIPIFDSNVAGFFKVLFLSFWVFMLTSCLDTHQDKLRDFSYQIKDYIHQSKTEKKFAYADSLKYERNYPLCTKAFRYILAHKPLNKEDSIYALNQIVFAYLKMDKDSLAEYFVQQLERIKGDFSEVQKADFLFNQGLLHLHLIKPTEAQSFLAKALKLYIAHYPNNHLRIALVKTARAQYYYDFGKHAHDFENAANEAFLCFYPRAETKPSVLHPYAAEAHFLMAHRYRSIYRDYRPGLNHCEVAEGLINSVPWKDTKLMARCLGVKGMFFKKDSLFHAADSVMNKGLSLLLATLPDNFLVQEMYRFLMVNAAGRADISRTASRALFNSYFVALNTHLRKFNQPEVYAQKDELKAYYFSQRAHLDFDSCRAASVKLKEKISPALPSFRYYNEEILNFLATVNAQEEKYRMALHYQLESFKTVLPKQFSKNINNWEQARKLVFNELGTNFFFFHYRAGSIFLKKYKKENEEADLEEAVAQFILADSLMTLRLTMGEEGVLTYYQEMEGAYFDPLEAIFELRKINQNPVKDMEIINLAFRFIERQKSFLLYREDILQGNEQIKIYLKQIKKEAKQLNLLQVDTTKQGFLTKALTSFRYQQLLVKLLKDARWKFNQKIKSVQSIQKSLGGREFVVQYKAIKKDYFLVLALGKNQIIFEKIDSLPRVQKLITDFNLIIRSENYKDTAFSRPAHELYKRIVAPLEKIIPKENAELIIIPDYSLNNLPFEALITKLPNANQVDMNFLLNKHIVVYSPSWKVWDYNRKEPLPQFNHRAAFFTYNQKTFRANLPRWEVEWGAMKSFFCRKATLYDRKFCTKEKFMQVAYRYKVLHFSLHGESNPLRLRENKLFFQLKDTLKTDTLSGVELRDLSLQGKLIILSACKTNDGKITPEGMYSLSRAFLQAGSACTISTLWSVNEQATSVILARFYSHLAQHSPWVALCKAKRDYLKTDSSKPYLWAGLVATI